MHFIFLCKHWSCMYLFPHESFMLLIKSHGWYFTVLSTGRHCKADVDWSQIVWIQQSHCHMEFRSGFIIEWYVNLESYRKIGIVVRDGGKGPGLESRTRWIVIAELGGVYRGRLFPLLSPSRHFWQITDSQMLLIATKYLNFLFIFFSYLLIRLSDVY